MAETGLSYKEERFCLEYSCDYNQTQAAIRAGYAEKSAAKQGCLLMKKPAVVARIRQLQKEQAERLMITSDRIMLELMDVYQKCMQAVPVEEWNYSEHRMEPTGEYQFDSKGATKALELLGRHLGMFDKRADDGGEGGPVYITGEDEIKE